MLNKTKKELSMIVVFGSLNADFFLNVLSFPKPGETVLTPYAAVKAGGKGANQAAAAAKAGGAVKMVGAIGADEIAKVPLTALKTAGVDCSFVQTVNQSTGMAMIMVDETAENSIVVASGANMSASSVAVPDSLLSPETVVVMQMEVPPAENFALLKRAKAKGATTVLNVAPAREIPAEALRNVDYLIVNEIEAETIVGRTGQSPEQTALALSEKTGGACLMTLGKKGVAAAKGGRVFSVASLPVKPVDTTGAGDAFVGIFAAGIDAGLPFAESVRRACCGAALACLKTGAQESLPSSREIDARLKEIEIK